MLGFVNPAPVSRATLVTILAHALRVAIHRSSPVAVRTITNLRLIRWTKTPNFFAGHLSDSTPVSDADRGGLRDCQHLRRVRCAIAGGEHESKIDVYFDDGDTLGEFREHRGREWASACRVEVLTQSSSVGFGRVTK